MAAKKMPKKSTETERLENDGTIDLMEHRAMIYMPEDAVEVTINAKIYLEGKLMNVSKVMSIAEIREAFQKADDGYIDDEDRFVITEKGKAFLEAMRKNGDEL